MTPREKLRAKLDALVAEMGAAGEPVEMTHKSGHRPDFIPDDGWSVPDDVAAAEAFAWLAVGAWHSKGALILAFQFAIRSAERAARAHERERCAALVDRYTPSSPSAAGEYAMRDVRNRLAAAIRALPEEPT